MRGTIAFSAAALAAATGVQAGGLDRTGQPVSLIFEDGNYAELSFARTNPTLEGNDVANLNPAMTPSGNVALSFNQIAGGVKVDINDQWSAALIYEQPWGSDISYPPTGANPLAPGSVLLGGTEAFANSHSITGILRYKFDDNFSAHAGLRYQQVDGEISLAGLAYGPGLGPGVGLNGYNVKLNRDGGVGWLVGGAYERPDIALRVAVTYQSAIQHEFDTVENLNPAATTTTDTKTPQSLNVDFQTGVAANTLVFGGIRWVQHSAVKVRPALANVDLVDLDDTTTYELGVGRKFTDMLAGSLAISYEAPGDDLVSPLAPSNGRTAITAGLRYDNGQIRVSGGVRYTMLGDAFAETGTPDTARASFSGNDALTFGLRVGYHF